MRKRKDEYYYRARDEQFRSRASYKLIELQEKFNIMREGDVVMDIGSSPGGWDQVAISYTNSHVISIDISPMEPMELVHFIKHDINDPGIGEYISKALSDIGRERVDVILSDAMTKASGDRSRDHAQSYLLCKRVMEISDDFLRKGGNVVVKQFQGDLTQRFLNEWRRKFVFSKITTVKASRAGSREIYLLFLNKR